MVAALSQLGHVLDVDSEAGTGNMTVRVQPHRMRTTTTIDCGLSGTVMRFVRSGLFSRHYATLAWRLTTASEALCPSPSRVEARFPAERSQSTLRAQVSS
jgi:hypothetical protein